MPQAWHINLRAKKPITGVCQLLPVPPQLLPAPLKTCNEDKRGWVLVKLPWRNVGVLEMVFRNSFLLLRKLFSVTTFPYPLF